MATNPPARQEQSPLNSLHEPLSERGGSRSTGCPPPDGEAPKAMPEEDTDLLESVADVGAPRESQTAAADVRADVANVEIKEPSEIGRMTQRAVTELEQVATKLLGAFCARQESKEVVEDDDFPPPPSPSPVSAGGHSEAFLNVRGEVEEAGSDTAVTSSSWSDRESVEQQQKIQDTKHPHERNISETENTAPQDSTCKINVSSDSFALNSPPFVDESEEEEVEGGQGVTICNPQWDGESQATRKASPTTCIAVKAPSLTAPPSFGQVGELTLQNSSEPSSEGGTKEAAQQVFHQGAPLVSAVAMESQGRGGAGGSVTAAGERCSSQRGETTEREKEQTGGQEEARTERELKQIELVWLTRHKKLPGDSKVDKGLEVGSKSRSCCASFPENRMESDAYDDSQSDSGVSVDFSPYSTMEINTYTPMTAHTTNPPTETPIQREIRRSIEREHSLRRSRGLPNRPTSPEYVEIPLRKAILSQPMVPKSEWSQDKDRQFAGKKMQNEINKEAQREHDLVKLGKIPGVYDKGTIRQLRERKQVFEAFQATRDSTFMLSVKSFKVMTTSSSSDGTDNSTLDDAKSEASTCKDLEVERRASLDLLAPIPTSTGGLAVKEVGRGGQQVIVLEHGRTPAQATLRRETVAEVDSRNPKGLAHTGGWMDGVIQREQEGREEKLTKENPFFRLRPSKDLVKVREDILLAQERERELLNQRLSLYGGERSTAEPAVLATTGSSTKGETAAYPLVGKLGVWPPSQAEEDKVSRSEVLINSQIVKQKTPLVQRWESGLVNGRNGDDH